MAFPDPNLHPPPKAAAGDSFLTPVLIAFQQNDTLEDIIIGWYGGNSAGLQSSSSAGHTHVFGSTSLKVNLLWHSDSPTGNLSMKLLPEPSLLLT